jgi:hypothetical protein
VLALLDECERMRQAVQELLPQKIGIAAFLPDDAVIPVDMTMGEIRRAIAALGDGT